MTAIGEEILAALRDTYLFSYFTGSVEELSSDQLVQVYLRLLSVFDNHYDMKGSSGKQSNKPISLADSAAKFILRCLRSLDLFHLVGSSKPSKIFDQKTSLRLLSGLHDKITARYGPKTAHRVRIVMKAEELARRARKKLPQDQQQMGNDASSSECQEKENSDSAAISANLPIVGKVEGDPLEVKSEGNCTSAPVSSQGIPKEVDRGACRPLRTEPCPVLIVPNKGRELARTPVRPQISTEKESCDEDSDDFVSSPPIAMEAFASPAHIQSDSATADTQVKCSKHDPTTDINIRESPHCTAKDFFQSTKTINDIPTAGDVGETITQPQRSTVSPRPKVPSRCANLANIRKSVAPILTGACVVELPMTPVGAPASEDRNVIPSGRQIARTPVAAPLGDDPSLEDSCVTPVVRDEMTEASTLARKDPVHVGRTSYNNALQEGSIQDYDERSEHTVGANASEELLHFDSNPVKESNMVTAGLGCWVSEEADLPSVTVADNGLHLENNRFVRKTPIDSPIVKKLLVHQESSPRFVPFSPDKGKKRLADRCRVSSVDDSDGLDVSYTTDGKRTVLCQSEVGIDSTLSSEDENDLKASPSMCRDLPSSLSNNTLEGAAEGCSSSVDLGNIILEPPHGFDSSCSSDQAEDKLHSSSGLNDSLAPETCLGTLQKVPAESFVVKESPDHLEVQKCNIVKTYLEISKMKEDTRKTLVLSKAVSGSDSKVRRTTFVIPQNTNCATAAGLNTNDCRRQTFVIPSDQIASNALIVKGNESRELVSMQGMDDGAFGDLTLLSKDFGETFFVDKNATGIQDCSTGHLALSSPEESSCSIKCPRSDSDQSEKDGNRPSTPSSRRGDTGDVTHVLRRRQLYLTPVAGLAENETPVGTKHVDDCNTQAQDCEDGHAIENGNEDGMEELLFAKQNAAEAVLQLQTGGEVSRNKGTNRIVIEKSLICEKDEGFLAKVLSSSEVDSTCSDLGATRSNESPIKPVKIELCINETYVKDSPIKENKLHQDETKATSRDKLISGVVAGVNNVLKVAVQGIQNSSDLDDSGNIFAPVKNKQVRRNIPAGKESRRGAANLITKRSRKDSIEHLLIKRLNEEHFLSPLNDENDQMGLSILHNKKEASQPKRGRNKNEVNTTANKKEACSTVSKTRAKVMQINNAVAKVQDVVELGDSNKGPSPTPVCGAESDEESVKSTRMCRQKKTARSTYSNLGSNHEGDASGDEVFNRLKSNKKSPNVTKGGKIVTHHKTKQTYSQKEKEHINASRKQNPRANTKNQTFDTMVITEPQAPIESDDLIGMRRSRRKKGTKVVDYNESPSVTQTLPPSGDRKGTTKHDHRTLSDDTLVTSNTNKTENVLNSSPTSSPESVLQAGTTDKVNLGSPCDGLQEDAHNFSMENCSGSEDYIIIKKTTHRERARGRGDRNGLSPVISASRGRGRRHNTSVNTNEKTGDPETVAPEARRFTRRTKSPAAALNSAAIEEYKSPENADNHRTKRGGKTAVTSSHARNKPGARKRGNVMASPTECAAKVAPSAAKRGSETRRGRTAAGRGKGRTSKAHPSKGGQLEGVDYEDISDEVVGSAHEKEDSSEVDLSAKKVGSVRVLRTVAAEFSADKPNQEECFDCSDDDDGDSMNILPRRPFCSTSVNVQSSSYKAKRTKTKKVAEFTADASVANSDEILIETKSKDFVAVPIKNVKSNRVSKRANKLLPDDLDCDFEKCDTGVEGLPVKRSRKGKGTLQQENNEVETITAAEKKGGKVQKKRSPANVKTTTKAKTKKLTIDVQENKSDETEACVAPKRKRQEADANELDSEIDEESPSKKLRENEMIGVAVEAVGTEAESVSSRGIRGTGASRTKTQAVKSRRKVMLDSPVGTTAVKKTGASTKSRAVTGDSRAEVQAEKPRVGRARAGRAAAKK